MKTAVRQFRDKAISVLTAFALLISVFSAFSLNFRASAEEAEDFVEMEIVDYHLWYKPSDKNIDFVDVSKTEDTLYVKDGDNVKFYLKWLIPNNLDNYNLQTEINTHGINFTVPAEGTLYYEGDAIGTYKVFSDDTSGVDRKTYFQAALDKDKVKDKSNISGGLIIDGVIELDKDGTVKNGSKQKLGYGEKSVDVIYDNNVSNGSVSISKNKSNALADDGLGNFTAIYSISVTIKGFIDSVTVTDILPEYFSVKEGTLSVTSGGKPASYEMSPEGKIVLSQVAGAGKNTSTTYNIQYTAQISEEDLMQEYVNANKSIVNTVYADYIDTDGNPAQKEARTSISTNKPSVTKSASLWSYPYNGSFIDTVPVTDTSNGKVKYCRVLEYDIGINTGFYYLDDNEFKAILKTFKDQFLNRLNRDETWLPFYDGYYGKYYINGSRINGYNGGSYLSYLLYQNDGNLEKVTWNESELNHACYNGFYKNNDGSRGFKYRIIILDDDINKNGIQNNGPIVNKVDVRVKDYPVSYTNIFSEIPGIDVLDKNLGINSGNYESHGYEPKGPDKNWYTYKYGLTSSASNNLSDIFPDVDHDPSTLDIPWEITLKANDLKKLYNSGGKVTLSDILGFVSAANGKYVNGQYQYYNNEYYPGVSGFTDPATHYFDTNDFALQLFYKNGTSLSQCGLITSGSLNVDRYRWSVDTNSCSDFSSFIFNSAILDGNLDGVIRYYSKIKLKDNGDGTYSIPDMFVEAMRNIYNTSTLQVNDEPPYNDNFTLQYKAPEKGDDKPNLSNFSKNSITSVSFGGEKKTLADDMSIGWWFSITVDNISSNRDGKADVLTFEDKLPEGLKFNKDSLIAVYWDGSGYSSSSSSLSTSKTLEKCELDSSCYTVAYDETERKITIKFTTPADFEAKAKELSAKRIAFFFSSDIEKDFISEHADVSSYTFKNSATVTYDVTTKESNTVSVAKKFPQLAKKSGVIVDEEFDPENYVTDMRMKARYTLEINPLALELIKDSKTLTVKDVMNEHLILLPETVQFIDGNTEEALKGAEYSFSYDPSDGNTVVFNIPDEAYVKIVYDTVIDVDPGVNPNWLKETNNKFTIDGLNQDNASAEVKTASFNGKVQAYVINETGSVTISKYFVENGVEHSLAGAEFMLYSVYNNFGDVTEDAMLAEPVVIPESGSVVINDLPLDRIYWLKEVSAPEGFAVDDIGTYFKLKGDSNVEDPREVATPDADTKALAEKITAVLGNAEIPEYEGNVASNVLKFLNIKAVSISGTKTWAGDSGYDVRPDDITLVLFANGTPYKGTYKTEWTKDGDKWTFTVSGLPESDKAGNEITYTLEEVKVPFYKSETTVAPDGKINITNTFAPEKVTVQGTKFWVNDSEDIRPDDITIILKANGAEVKGAVPVWTKSGDKWTYKFDDLDKYTYTKADGVVKPVAVKYDVKEIVPDGYTSEYVRSEDAESNTITVNITNTATVTEITKVDENGDPLLGAELVVTDKNGKPVDAWTTATGAHTITGLIAGETYYLSEKTAPDGYNTAETIEFTVKGDGTVLELKMTDTVTVTEISKTDKDGNFVPNAHLILKDENGDTVADWVTGNEVKVIEKLTAGKTYTLIELSAPDGYTVAKEIQFTVKATTIVRMTDSKTETEITKVDENGDALAGAHLVVTDEKGTKVDEWESKTEPHQITGLVAGKTYTITETKAPDGYAISEPKTFKVESDKVTVVTFGNELTVTEITKVDENNQPIAGAHLIVTDKNGTKVDEWESKTEPHQITGLVAGETYTITETKAPDGYAISEPQKFTVNADGSLTEFAFENALTVTEITKVDENGNALAGAHLILKNKNGVIVERWISSDSSYRITGLTAGEKYTLIELNAPDGYETALPITFEVKGNGEVTVVVMEDSLKTDSSPETGVTGGAAVLAVLSGAAIVIFSKKKRK